VAGGAGAPGQLVVRDRAGGSVRVLHAFTGLLDASSCPVVVNVSTGVGLLAYASNPHGPHAELNLLAYPASKAALNMLTLQWAKAHPAGG
jgi:NAD(P)-dependent dehydrogenase (short-subunit alcohol dehydrogenase family)